MEPDTGFLKALSTLKTAASVTERNDLCNMLEESYALMKRWNCTQLRLWVLRDKVFEPLQLSVESNDPRLCTPAVKCLQTFLHDERFKSCTEFLSDHRWIPTQVLHTLCSCSSFGEGGQMEVLKILLDIALSSQWQLNANLLIKLIELCLRMADSFSASCDSKLPPVVSSTLNQILQTVVTAYHRSQSETFDSLVCVGSQTNYSPLPDLVIGPEEDQRLSSAASPTQPHSVRTPPVNAELETTALRHDVLAILDYLVVQCRAPGAGDQQPLSLQRIGRLPTALSAIHTILLHLPTGIVQFQEFTDFVWKDLCPTLVSLMHSNLSDGSPSKKLTGPFQSPEFGRGSGLDSMNCAPPLEIYSVVYGISLRLAHLVGPLIEMRPVLESLFHSFMLYPPPKQRVAALKAIHQLLASETELMRITLPCWHIVPSTDGLSPGKHDFVPVSDWACVNQPKSTIPVPFRLIRILLDSLIECSCSGDSALVHASVACLTTLMTTLERLATGDHVEPWLAVHLVSQLTQFADKDQAATVDQSSLGTTAPDKAVIVATSKSSDPDHERMARDFLEALLDQLPGWRELTSVDQLDRALLAFASHFCTSRCDHLRSADDNLASRGPTILNADAIYVTSYAALALNRRLWLFGHYDTKPGSWKLTESDQQQFIDSVLNRKLLVYLPRSFLSEVYRLVTTQNYLQLAGYDLSTTARSMHVRNHVNMSKPEVNGHTLSEFSDPIASGPVLYAVLDAYNGNCPELQAKCDWRSFLFDQPPALVGSTLVQTLLVVTWDALLWSIAGVFCTPSVFDPHSRLHIVRLGEYAQLELQNLSKWVRLLPQSTAENRALLGTAVFNAIYLVEMCLRLAGKLHQVKQMEQLLALIVHLVHASIRPTVETPARDAVPDVPVSVASKRSGLHAVQVYLLDTVLQCALDGLVSDSRSWLMVFRVCRLIAALEHQQFATATHALSASNKLQKSSYAESKNDNFQNASQLLNRLHRSTTCNAISSSGHVEVVPKSDESLIGSSGFVNMVTAEHLLGLLRHSVDQLFQQAANRVSLPDLLTFVTSLLSASRESSLVPDCGSVSVPGQAIAVVLPDPLGINPLLDRLCQFLLDLTYGCHRPLLHILYLWAAISDQLIKVCHLHGWFLSDAKAQVTDPTSGPQPVVAQRVLDSMHTCILTVMTSYPELPHFTVNEAMCKPLENTIKLELCDPDLQDRLITCICGLVESGSDYLRSAWKPLFSALRSIRLDGVSFPPVEHELDSSARLTAQIGLFQRLKRALFQPSLDMSNQPSDPVAGIDWAGTLRHQYSVGDMKSRRLGTVMEIFDVYLSTVNEDVFCDTAVDCLVCLLHFASVFRRTSDSVTGRSALVPPEGDVIDQSNVTDVLFEEQSWCTLSNGDASDELNSMLFRTEAAWDNSQPPNDINNGDLHAATATMFLSALTCLMRCVYWLERLWSRPRAPPVKQARHQFELSWALERHKAESGTPSDQRSHYEQLLSALDALDNGTGILFAYALIVHQLLDLVWTAEPVQRNLLLDTVLRLVRGASICFPCIASGSVQSQSHSDGDNPRSLTLELTSHVLLPQIRRWIEIHVQSCDSIEPNGSAQPEVEQQPCEIDAERFVSDSDPTPDRAPTDQGGSMSSDNSGHVLAPTRLLPCSVCIARYRDLRFLRLTLGHLTELVLDYCTNPESPGAEMVFEQFLLMLRVVTVSTDDSLCYLGPTCLRHMLLTHGTNLPESYWSQLVQALAWLLSVTRKSLDRLIDPSPVVMRRTHTCSSPAASDAEVQHLRLVAQPLCSDPTTGLVDQIPKVEQSQSIDQSVTDGQAPNFSPQTFEVGTEHTSSSSAVMDNLCSIIRGLISHELLIQTVVDLFVWRAPRASQQNEANEDPISHGRIDGDRLFGVFDQFVPSTGTVEHLNRLTVRQCLSVLKSLCQRYTCCLWLQRDSDARLRLQRFLNLRTKPDFLFQAVSTVSLVLRMLAYLMLRHNVVVDSDSELPAAHSSWPTFADFVAQSAAALEPPDSSDSLSNDGDWSILRGLFTRWFNQLLLGATITPENREKECHHLENHFARSEDRNTEVDESANPISADHSDASANHNGSIDPTHSCSFSSETGRLNGAFVEALARFMIWLPELVQSQHLATDAFPKRTCNLECWCAAALASFVKLVVLAAPDSFNVSLQSLLSQWHLLPEKPP